MLHQGSFADQDLGGPVGAPSWAFLFERNDEFAPFSLRSAYATARILLV
jgi:hypothetical protein